jgi:imidazoleglycerol phosphate dehydratase HisB
MEWVQRSPFPHRDRSPCNGRKRIGRLTPHFLFQIYHQIKKHETITNDVTKSLDKTLKAFQNVEDAIIDVKTQRNVMTDKTKIADYDKILVQLEKASDELISAITLFQKHEGSL